MEGCRVEPVRRRGLQGGPPGSVRAVPEAGPCSSTQVAVGPPASRPVEMPKPANLGSEELLGYGPRRGDSLMAAGEGQYVEAVAPVDRLAGRLEAGRRLTR